MSVEWDTFQQKISDLIDEISISNISDLSEIAIELADLADYFEEIFNSTSIAELSKSVKSAEHLIKKQTARISELEQLQKLSTDQTINYYIQKYERFVQLSTQKIQEAEQRVRIAEQKVVDERRKANSILSENESYFRQRIKSLEKSLQQTHREIVKIIEENERLRRIKDEQNRRVDYLARYIAKPFKFKDEHTINLTQRAETAERQVTELRRRLDNTETLLKESLFKEMASEEKPKPDIFHLIDDPNVRRGQTEGFKDERLKKNEARKPSKIKTKTDSSKRMSRTKIENKAVVPTKRYTKPTREQIQVLLGKKTRTSINELGLSDIVKVRLSRWSIRYVEQLTEYRDDYLLSVPGIDQESLNEIWFRLGQFLDKLANNPK